MENMDDMITEMEYDPVEDVYKVKVVDKPGKDLVPIMTQHSQGTVSRGNQLNSYQLRCYQSCQDPRQRTGLYLDKTV